MRPTELEPRDRHRVTGQRRAVVLRAQHRNGGTGFGESVRVDEINARERGQRGAQYGRRHPGAAVRDRAQRRDVRGGAVEFCDDASQHRRHDHRVRHPVVSDKIEPLARAEVRQVRHPPTGVQIAQHRTDTGDVVGRHADQHRVILAGGAELYGLQHVAQQVGMPQHHAFWFRRGAAGEQHHGRIAVVDRNRCRGFGAKRHGQPVLRQCRGRHRFGERAIGHHVGAVQLGDQRVQLAGGEPIVQRCQRDSCPRGREHQGGQDRAVQSDVGDAACTRRAQHGGAARRGAVEIGEGEALVTPAEGYPVGLGAACHVEDEFNSHGCLPVRARTYGKVIAPMS